MAHRRLRSSEDSRLKTQQFVLQAHEPRELGLPERRLSRLRLICSCLARGARSVRMSGRSKAVPFISMWFLACVVFLYLTPRAIAQNDEPLDPTPTEGPENSAYSLSGTVVNALTGGPVRRALVQIGDQSGGAAVTDDAGHFQIAGLKEGQAFVSVTKPGFGDWRAPEQSVVQVGKDAPAVVLKIVQAFDPGMAQTSAASPLELSPCREVEANFDLSPEPLYHESRTASAEGET